MLYKQSPGGLIPYLRDCLKGPTYGEPKTRVTLAADFQVYLEGQSKMIVPTIVISPGPTTYEDVDTPGGNVVRQHMIEQIDIMVVLNSKRDKVGNFPVDDVHQVRKDLLRCMVGFNAFIQADCNGVDYGYCTKEIRGVGDDWFSHDKERYVHEFNFALWSEINSIEQGVGPSFPAAVNDLNNIFLDIEPSEIEISEQPAKEVTIPST